MRPDEKSPSGVFARAKNSPPSPFYSCSEHYSEHSCLSGLRVTLQMAVVIDTEGPASSVTFGDDVVTVETLVNGTVDAIKLELELLPAVGEVSFFFEILSRNMCTFPLGRQRSSKVHTRLSGGMQ